MKASKSRDRANVPPWFKEAEAFLERSPLPIVELVADRLRRRERARPDAPAAKKRKPQGHPLRARSLPAKSLGLKSKPETAAPALLSSTDVPVVSRRVSPSERIESSDRKMIPSVTEQEPMKKGKKNPQTAEAIPAVDEVEFTDVIRKMVNTSPVTREDVEGKGYRRKKNPETDPAKLQLLFPAVPNQRKR